jgi:hypothetical protein
MNLHQQLVRNRLSAALELERNPGADQSKWIAQIEELESIAQGDTRVCTKPVDCGGVCILKENHTGPCLCIGDNGIPGTCPA